MTSPDDARYSAGRTGRRRREESAKPSRRLLLRPVRRIDIVPAAIVGKHMKTYQEDRGPPGRATFFAPFLVLAISFSVATAGLARAEGALAVGIARGGIAKGYATGFSINQPTAKVARSNAVEQCKRTKSSNADAKAGCEVVVTFHNKCVASAVDPQNGTPGAGWGVGVTQELADSQALARCRAKAGADRAEFCEVTDRFCDGK